MVGVGGRLVRGGLAITAGFFGCCSMFYFEPSWRQYYDELCGLLGWVLRLFERDEPVLGYPAELCNRLCSCPSLSLSLSLSLFRVDLCVWTLLVFVLCLCVAPLTEQCGG